MLYKISQGLVDIPTGQFLKCNRNGVHFQTIDARTRYYEFSFFPRTVAAWNELSSDTLLAQNLAMFKQTPYAHLVIRFNSRNMRIVKRFKDEMISIITTCAV